MFENIHINNITVKPAGCSFYLPPMSWKGDCVGHIGSNDTFFWVLEGECFLLIESDAAIIRPGQLAYLPKGKKRMYTHISERFCMYEMAFDIKVNEKNLMEVFGFTDGNYVVDIEDKEKMSKLFENSYHTEMFKNPLYDVASCANIINIVKKYAEARSRLKTSAVSFFEPVLKRMSEATDRSVTTEELSDLVYMQPSYFIRMFKKAFGVSPQNYFRHLKLYKAMNLLASTDLPLDEVSRRIGIDDTSYFARFFKKNCRVTPSEYRKAFKKGM